MGRPPCCEESGVKRGPWTPEEDEKLMNYISKHGSGNWRTVPKHAGLNRCGKSCRLRWTNYLRSDIKRGKFTEEEEQLIINLHSVLGNKWSKIATHLPGRTDNEIKNLWNTHIRKKLLQMGIDPETHKPRTDLKHLMNLSQLVGISNNNKLMSHWGHAPSPLGLHLQQPDVNQLAQLQLLQNILLQLINGNSSCVNIMGNHHSQMSNPLDACLNGPDSSGLMKGQELCGNSALFPPPQSDSQQEPDVSESWIDLLQGESNPRALGFDNSNSTISSSSTSSHEMNQAENPLVSASPESGTFNQMESGSDTDQMSTHSPSSSIFNAWEKLLEDDTTDSYWKEILI